MKITNKISRSFNIVLRGGINNSNRYIAKKILLFRLQFPVTISRESDYNISIGAFDST